MKGTKDTTKKTKATGAAEGAKTAKETKAAKAACAIAKAGAAATWTGTDGIPRAGALPFPVDSRYEEAAILAAAALAAAGAGAKATVSARGKAALDVASLLPARDGGDARLKAAAATLVAAAYAPFVRWIVRARFAPYAKAHMEDLEQAGAVGVMRAFARYDGSGAFATYARHYAHGELADYVNFLHGQTKHYRALQEKVSAARDALAAEGKAATPAAVSRACGLPLQTVKRELAVMERRFVSFEGLALAEVTEG